MQRGRANTPLFWSVLVVVVIADIITKAIAGLFARTAAHSARAVRRHREIHARLQPGRGFRAPPRRVFALDIHGPHDRRPVHPRASLSRDARRRSAAHARDLARLRGRGRQPHRSHPVGRRASSTSSTSGIGDARWPTFNVADMAVSIGAFLLAWVLWGEDNAPEREAQSRRKARHRHGVEHERSSSAHRGPGHLSAGERHEFVIEADGNVRLDLLVAARADVSRTQAATLVANGNVSVNGKKREVELSTCGRAIESSSTSPRSPHER